MRKIWPYEQQGKLSGLPNPDWPIINGEKLDVEGCIEKLKLPEDDEWVLAVQAQETGAGLKSRVIKRKIDMEKERGGPRPKTRMDMLPINPATGDTIPRPQKIAGLRTGAQLQEIVKEELIDIIKKKRKTQKNRK